MISQRLIFRWLIVISFTTVLLGSTVGAAEPENGMAFADFLMLQKRYREAELEYERIAYHDPTKKVIDKMLNAALQTGDNAFSLALARAWEARVPDTLTCLPSMYVSRSLYRMGNFEGVLARSLKDSCEDSLKAEHIYLRASSLLWLSEWPQASAEFRLVSPDSSLRPQALRASDEAMKGAQLHPLSPVVAGTLSAALPGSGYWYAHRPQTAAAALVVNGLFISSTYFAAQGHETALASLLGLFSFGWYFGGVAGSVRAAERENHKQLADFIRPFDDKMQAPGEN